MRRIAICISATKGLLRLLALCALAFVSFASSPTLAQSHSRAEIEVLAEYYAGFYSVPIELVRRVINRESTFNPSARNGPYYGLMQILPETARTMGYTGTPQGLLNAETNLIYAVRYLRGAWLLSGGSHDRAVQLYAAGYYYHARDAGMLEQTGLRTGPANPPLPQPVGAAGALAAIAPDAQPEPQGQRRTLLSLFSGNNDNASTPQPVVPAAPPITASIASGTTMSPTETQTIPPVPTEPAPPEPALAESAAEAEPVAVALGALPPRRPAALAAEPEPEPEGQETAIAAAAALSGASESQGTPGDALMALAAATALPEGSQESDPFARLERDLEWASAYAGLRPAYALSGDADLLGATFALLDPVQALMLQAEHAPGSSDFLPPARPGDL